MRKVEGVREYLVPVQHELVILRHANRTRLVNTQYTVEQVRGQVPLYNSQVDPTGITLIIVK